MLLAYRVNQKLYTTDRQSASDIFEHASRASQLSLYFHDVSYFLSLGMKFMLKDAYTFFCVILTIGNIYFYYKWVSNRSCWNYWNCPNHVAWHWLRYVNCHETHSVSLWLTFVTWKYYKESCVSWFVYIIEALTLVITFDHWNYNVALSPAVYTKRCKP